MTTEISDIQEEQFEEDILAHYGTPRESGRYPWGSGDNPHQRNRTFLQQVDALRKQGLSETQIAEGLGLDSTTQLRARKKIAKNELVKAQQAEASELSRAGKSNVEIGRILGINESVVRQRLNPSQVMKADVLMNTVEVLRKKVDKTTLLDVGVGVEHHIDADTGNTNIGVSRVQLQTAVAVLKEEGYGVHYINVEQQGTGKQTRMLVLSKPGTDYTYVYKNQDKIAAIGAYSEDNGHTFREVKPPVSIDSKRVAVRYAEQGGNTEDGVIHLRRGVDDIGLGQSQYAQVRIAVDGSHYLKGMAVYKDDKDMPKGVDMVFNTNKSDTGNKLDAMKPIKRIKVNGEDTEDVDLDAPFGSIVFQRHYLDKNGKEQQSVINIVNEEGKWDEWSKNLSSQVLSKQSVALAKEQLQKRLDVKKAEYAEINALTNPAVRKKLLESFADDMDSSSVKMKAAALPRQRTQVILPINTLSDNEIYAPNFREGERVALVRYPHGGIFEIPQLTVNNSNKEAKNTLGAARDAVGINSTVASRLSGADFDGDTVLVIPNNLGKIRSSPPLKELEGFDPQAAYPRYEGMKLMDAQTKALKMGDVSNLITDMTIKKASQAELARAVKHSMVVIDAEKHKLNWKQSAIDNDINALKKKYQGDARKGAATLISRSSSDFRVPERKPRPAAQGGPIDKETGRKMYVETGAEYVNSKGETVQKKDRSTQMAEVEDAYELSSGTPMEEVYARHANSLKALANEARKTMVNTPSVRYSPSANKTYKAEDRALSVKLNRALKNKPLERQAQLLAGSIVKTKRDQNADMDKADLKKLRGQALKDARERVGADKFQIIPTPSEWEAIQSGAISNNKLVQILNNTDVDYIKQLATPRAASTLTPASLMRAQQLIRGGATAAEAADALGISVSTLNASLYPRKEN